MTHNEGAPPTKTELEKPGVIIGGRFKLLQQIGEGGMGAVWMADQFAPVKRRVALKVVKPGMDSGQVLGAAFEAERQAAGADGSSEHRQSSRRGDLRMRPTLFP